MGIQHISIIFLLIAGMISTSYGRSLKSSLKALNNLNRPTEYFCKTDDSDSDGRVAKIISCQQPRLVKGGCTDEYEQSMGSDTDEKQSIRNGSNIFEADCDICGQQVRIYGKVSNDNIGDPGQTSFERKEFDVSKMLRDIQSESDFKEIKDRCYKLVNSDPDKYGDFFEEKTAESMMRDEDKIETIRDLTTLIAQQTDAGYESNMGTSIFDEDMNPIMPGLPPSGKKCDYNETEVADYIKEVQDARKVDTDQTTAEMPRTEFSSINTAQLPYKPDAWPSAVTNSWGYVLAENEDHKKDVEESMQRRLKAKPRYEIPRDEMKSRSHHLIFNGTLPTKDNLEKVLEDSKLLYNHRIISPRCDINPKAEFLNVSQLVPIDQNFNKLITQRYKLTCTLDNKRKKSLTLTPLP